jgi:CRP/FNR family transcriptional regulator, cyclic AMP receptor protein
LSGIGLTPEQLATLRDRGRNRSYRAGTILYHEGDDSDFVVLIEAGWVKVSSQTADGRQAVLAVLGPGELIGELATFSRDTRSATITAIDDVTASVVTGTAFREFLTEAPDIALRLLETMSQRLRDADRKRVEFGAYDVDRRLVRRLVELAERFGEPDGDEVRIPLPLTHEDLADWVASSREAVSKALGELRRRGLVRTDRRRITVLDLEALRTRGR